MDIEFDTAKDVSNLDKHGVSLAFGVEIFADDDYLVLPSIRPVDGEDRFKIIGDEWPLDGCLRDAGRDLPLHQREEE